MKWQVQNMNNRAIKRQILDAIRQYQRIILMRHFRPDGDAVGSTKGLQAILRATYPEKEILLINEDYADYTAFMGPEDPPIDDSLYADALILALDTGTQDRLSNKKSALGRQIVKIDHHIDDKPYGDLCWVEEWRSSTCEMIVDFFDTFRDELVMTKEAATYLFIGMVTDSGRFRYRDVSGETMRMAGILLDMGIDTDRIFANLYLQDFSELKRKAQILNAVRITENGVAHLYITKARREKLGLTLEQASNAVNEMDAIKGSMIWIAFIETDENIRVRLRSRFVEVQPLATRYRGGGHACAAGATVYSRKEARKLIREADALLAAFKSTHEDCL